MKNRAKLLQPKITVVIYCLILWFLNAKLFTFKSNNYILIDYKCNTYLRSYASQSHKKVTFVSNFHATDKSNKKQF